VSKEREGLLGKAVVDVLRDADGRSHSLSICSALRRLSLDHGLI